MEPMSKEEYLRLFESKSSILNPQRDIKSPPNSTKFIFGLDGLKEELNLITTKELNKHGMPIGKIEHYKKLRKTAKAAWNYFNNAQALPKNKPHDRFADDINRYEAQILVNQKIARVLNKKIAEIEEQEAKKREPKPKRKRRMALSGRMVDGHLVFMGGRNVEQREGVNFFVGTDEKVDDYIAKIKARQHEELEESKKAQQQRRSAHDN